MIFYFYDVILICMFDILITCNYVQSMDLKYVGLIVEDTHWFIVLHTVFTLPTYDDTGISTRLTSMTNARVHICVLTMKLLCIAIKVQTSRTSGLIIECHLLDSFLVTCWMNAAACTIEKMPKNKWTT